MEALQNFLTQYSGFEAYAIFTVLISACCVGLFNSDIAFITAGALSAIGFFDYRILIVLGFCGLMAGDSITFFAGRKWGRSLARKKPFSFVINDQKMETAENFFRKKGVIILFFVRFLPLLRTPLFLTAGSLRADPKKFYLFNSISSLIYLPIVIIGSNRASAHAGEIISTLKRFQFIPVFVLATIGVIYYFKKSRVKKEGVL